MAMPISSRSISWWMASLIAPMYGISRAMSSSLGVDVLRRLFGLRIRTLDAEVDSRLHLPAGLLGDAVGVLGGQRALLHEAGAEARHRVAAQGRLVLLGSAELLDRLVLGVVERHPRW